MSSRSLFAKALPVIRVSLALCSFAIFAVLTVEDLLSRKNPGVVVITVESLREDMVSKETTPKLLAAAEHGLHFSSHRAISAWTAANIVSLLSGLDPFSTAVHSRGDFLEPPGTVPLAQLVGRGYRVEGLQPFMAMDVYRNLGFSLAPEAVNPQLWLAQRQVARERFFLWYHYVDTHLPYQSPFLQSPAFAQLPAATRARLEKISSQPAVHAGEARYQPEDFQYIRKIHRHSIEEFDRWFGEFWNFFTESGSHRNTILILTADHGDEYGERGMVGHASTTLAGHLHEEIVRVPLLLWLPENLLPRDEPQLTSRGSSHLDIIPTVFALLGIAPQIPLPGHNLLGTDGGEEWLGMTSSGGFAEPDPTSVRYFEYGYRLGRHKSLLRVDRHGAESYALFDLVDDPGEVRDLAAELPEIAEGHRAVLAAHIGGQTKRRPSAVIKETAGDNGLQWLHPGESGTYSYDDLGGRFHLEWQGDAERNYLLEYQAGKSGRQISGLLNVAGSRKDFGGIDRDYWQTWIVPHSPYRLRVRDARGGSWSPWLELEAVP
jgi:arylsulfatase A-like enzyme